MNQYNDKNQKHGYWEYYYPNRNIMSKGDYVNAERHGYWEYYYPNRNIIRKR
jgi:antitoxin component YwqK of YwqJK toxin-antitoxin module